MPKDEHENRDSTRSAITIAIIGAVASVFAAYITANGTTDSTRRAIYEDQSSLRDRVAFTEFETSKVVASSVGTLAEGQKLCRVLQGRTWRDGVIVPKDWGVINCVDYMKKTEGNGYQLGCVYSDGVNLAKPDGSLPSPNCGWK